MAKTRLALVIGNASYQRVTPLANAVNDANLIASSLIAQGFDVTLQTDTDLKRLKRALSDFFGKVQKAGKDTAIVVYYAGHGVQVGGANYLIPIDAQIDREGDVDIEAVKADSIMGMIAYSGSSLNIIILDACRNNPFRGFRSAGRGLAQIEAPSGTLVAFSTSPGKVARDGPTGGNSPYTAVLAKTLAEPGITIEDVFKRVRRSVNTETNGDQVPWESSSLVGYFYPAGRGSQLAPAPVVPAVAAPVAVLAPPVKPSPAPPAAPIAGSWVLLGSEKIGFLTAPYSIPIPSNVGRFTKIRFRAIDRAMSIFQVKVRFSNNETDTIALAPSPATIETGVMFGPFDIKAGTSALAEIQISARSRFSDANAKTKERGGLEIWGYTSGSATAARP